MKARSTPAEPLLAWPGLASLRLTLPLSYLFSKIFFSIYGGTSLLAHLRAPREAFHFSWELRMPFVPSAALIYLSVPLALLLTPFILRTWRTFVPFFLTLTAETLVGGLFFLLIPVAQAYPQRVASGFFGGVFRLADRINLDYNEFPSLHIAFALTAAFVFGRRCGWLGRTLFALWAVVVCASAMLMHEHHLFDIAGGAVLGLAAVATVQRWVSREAYLDALRIEALCLREISRFVRRHARRLFAVLALTRASLPRWRATRVLRAAYCLAQHVADVLGGDRPAPGGDPEAYVRSLLRGLRGEAPFGKEGIAPLAAYVSAELRRFEAGPDDPRGDLVALLETLREDRRRMEARRALTADELAAHHRRTCFHSLNLAFTLTGSRLRAADAPDLLAALSWAAPVRDLQKDLEKGLINVPAEVLECAGWNPQAVDLTPLLDAPAVRDWLRAEHHRAAACIEVLGARLAAKDARDDPQGRRILALFHRELASYERRYRRKNAGLIHPARTSMPDLQDNAG